MSDLIKQNPISQAVDTFNTITGRAKEQPIVTEKFKISGQDWYKVFGYQFVIAHIPDPQTQQTGELTVNGIKIPNPANNGGASDSDSQTKFYTLPIPPQSLVIKPIIASQATPTLGGVIEETSENLMWMINMQGTTGIAISRAENDTTDRKSVAKQFRATLSTTGLLAGITAQLNQTLSKIGNIADNARASADSILNGDIAGGIGNAVNVANSVVLPQLPYAGSAILEKSNGFTEIQELAKFFDKYNELKHANPKEFSLLFRMYKTSQEWNCIVQDFTIQKSAQSPHLWRYNIVLKCWGLRVVGANNTGGEAFDRFGSGGDLKSVNTVGLNAIGQLNQINKQGGFNFG